MAAVSGVCVSAMAEVWATVGWLAAAVGGRWERGGRGIWVGMDGGGMSSAGVVATMLVAKGKWCSSKTT